MLRTRNLTLSSTPTLLTITDGVDGPCTISIQNTDNSKSLFIGEENVSSSSYGIKLTNGLITSIDLSPYDKLYAVGDGTTVAVLILER